MVNLKKILQGFGLFLAGYIIIYLMELAVPPIITALETIFTNTDLNGIIWFGIIILWTTISVIAPSFLVITGLKENNQEKNPLLIIAVILGALFGLLLTIYGWYIIETLSNLTIGFTNILFWMGLITIWIELIIVTPTYIIIQNTKQ